MMGATFDPSDAFCLGSGPDFLAHWFRRVERRTGGAGGLQADKRGIWWDVEITVTQWVPETAGTTNPGHHEIVSQRLVHESSWCSVVSSMGAHGEDTLTYGLAQALHRSGVS